MEHEISTQQMDSLKVLSDTNLKISEAKNILFKLQETETEYLETRERKALAQIQRGIEESRDLIQEIKNNHHEVQEFSKSVSEIAGFLSEIQEKFFLMLSDFNNRSDAWDQEYKKQYEELAEIRKIIHIEKTTLANDRKANAQELKIIKEEKERIASRQAQIKSALEVLKSKQ